MKEACVFLGVSWIKEVDRPMLDQDWIQSKIKLTPIEFLRQFA